MKTFVCLLIAACLLEMVLAGSGSPPSSQAKGAPPKSSPSASPSSPSSPPPTATNYDSVTSEITSYLYSTVESLQTDSLVSTDSESYSD